MDEWTLNDLLECSVCLERLDTSSKVLPCQHTFCKKCLEEIVATHKELRCPECRILVEAKIDELPPNVLLMRILEGMRNAGNPIPKKKVTVVHRPVGNQLPLPSLQVPPSQSSQNIGENNTHTALKQNSSPNQPFARAIFDYISKESGDLSFKKGDIIVLHRKIDTQWCQGEFAGKTGVFPLSYVQVMTPLPNQIATCKALYDFRMTNEEEEGCLSFQKDEIITVIRRVDENWAEGKLNDRIGIFPMAFVEMNSVARALMKLSTNSQPGPSRVAPPTPTTEESTPLIPTDHSRTVSSCVHASQNNTTVTVQAPPTQASASPQPINSTLPGSGTESSSTVSSSSSTTPNSSSNTSSSSSTAPSSPASNQPVQNANPFLPPPQTPRQMILQTSYISNTNTTHGVLPTSHITAQQSPLPPRSLAGAIHCHRSPPQVTQPEESHPPTFQQKEKRHSFSVTTQSHHYCSNSNRHSAEILSSELASDVPNLQLSRHGSQRHRRTGSDLSSVTNLPATYVALYPYKPQKADELELKKGGVYLVTERCQDGWFKGTSNRTQKCGVFPGNYVTLAKPIGLQGSQSRVKSSSPRDAATPSPDHKNSHHAKSPRQSQTNGRQPQVLCVPPELPPRAVSPSVRHDRPSAQNATAAWLQENHAPNIQKCAVDVATPLPANTLKSENRQSTTVSPPPNVSVVSTGAKTVEKAKEKKEKSSLMKRLAGMKRSKSPPTSSPSYSMDNPVFDDTPITTPQLAAPLHPVHSRSGSCPSQLIQLMPDGASHPRLFSASVSARLKHKERPSVSNANFAHTTSRQVENGAVATAAPSGGSSHRKSNSLDAGDSRKPRQLVPPVRERFRCIVPYPPNSEYELELRLGDIIYVHKKREDGWYKGTQQRTGRTGLFPASFVETY